MILGDLFDTWLIPVDKDPLPDFQAIVACDGNKKVITALKDLAAKDKLTYIPGNHDMSMPVSDVEQNLTRNFLETTFPRINYDPHDNGKYENGTIVGEHGHRHDLYNAPDIDWYLPIGYFISRVAAYKVAKEGKAKEDFHGIFKGFPQSIRGQPPISSITYLLELQRTPD